MKLIDGVTITNLKQIHDERGSVMHMLRKDDLHFKSFGEIYFSTVHFQAIKAWHLHKEMILNYAVIQGKIKFVLYDNRDKSPTKGTINEFFLSNQNYVLITVPPLVWNGFKGVSIESSIIANCTSVPHSKDEILRLPFETDEIPYKWRIQNQ